MRINKFKTIGFKHKKKIVQKLVYNDESDLAVWQ